LTNNARWVGVVRPGPAQASGLDAANLGCPRKQWSLWEVRAQRAHTAQLPVREAAAVQVRARVALSRRIGGKSPGPLAATAVDPFFRVENP
jgi:hypothetical protein